MVRNFFLGFIKIHILHHAAEEPLYGLALIAELRSHGYELSAGTLYPVLHSLEASGYLVHKDRVVDGKARKYYAITAKGRRALTDARHKIVELVDEVLRPHTPRRRRRRGSS
jgi:DNA-binding PadR family transcriptional regulator